MRNVLFLVALGAVLFCSSCKNDETYDINLQKTEVEVLKGKWAYIYMYSGNGAYTFDFTEEGVADVKVEHGTVKVQGLEYGSTTLTITDRLNKKASLKIDVVETLTNPDDNGGIGDGGDLEDEDDD